MAMCSLSWLKKSQSVSFFCSISWTPPSLQNCMCIVTQAADQQCMNMHPPTAMLECRGRRADYQSSETEWVRLFNFSFLNSSSSRLHFLLFNSPSDSEVESWAQRGDKWEPFSSVLHFKDADVFFLVLTKSTIILWRFLAQLRPWSQPNKCCHLYLISS